ncbi:TIGR03085 family metal-binding protein [Saccharopolyspora sp. NFXS83]|uniref:TIGR03085 family metal-binding protein n=1 Tax=Saccharopolyspora sp. NFXS83 TaxID=2993560 RepID=UPI00224B0C5A|nr:TIGR03085 family metal-binding protein [Saccharopolyspora sp. NFXS83]MCX2732926.1 TIGR03085 family metal-binding protein [Saccharopolyspora sp. NFXS83]
MGVANDERRELCDLFDRVGPDAPTLCGEWKTKDLAVHLVLRERRPDALAGKFVKALAERGDKVEQGLREQAWPELIATVREGAPKWNPLAIGAVDETVNTAEFFVHHEDVRRAQPGWQPRPSEPEREEALWKSLSRVAKVFYGRSPVGVVLRRPDGTEIAAKRGPRTVRISGEPSELLLHAFSRRQVRVDIDGNDADVLAVEDLRRSF